MVTGKTQLTGLIGDPVEHSLSPAMHNAAFAHLGMDWIYLPFHVRGEGLGVALEGLYAANLRGLNVTIPHKLGVCSHLVGISPRAQASGAVNLLIRSDRGWLGENSDGLGFLRSLREVAAWEPQGRPALILGAGGSARAVAYALVESGAQVLIAARRFEQAREIAQITGGQAIPWEEPALRGALDRGGLLVHTTPVGMFPRAQTPPVIPGEWLHPGLLVADLVYTPRETSLLRAADQAGAQTLSGLGMLLYQGAISFQAWTGVEPPIQPMQEALLGALGEKEL